MVREPVRELTTTERHGFTMSPHTSTRNEPPASPAQLKYLKDLASQAGCTFEFPKTRRQASCEIDQLKTLKARRGTHREFPRDADPREQPYATEQKPGETIGYGSTARRREQALEDLALPPAPRPAPDEPLELGRYETKEGEKRGLYCIRIDGQPRIIDAAAEGRGRTYTVQEEIREDESDEEVKDIVAAYIEQAGELERIPMASMRSAS
jgi:hypothetical protein